jgi:septum formation protein
MLDEAAIKAAGRQAGSAVEDVAMALAEAKATADDHGTALVVGADQILDCDGSWFDKPTSIDGAAAHLRALSGRTHRLVSAVCVAGRGDVRWRHVESPRMTMRRLDDGFIDDYLARAGPSVLDSVGAYRLESLGAQLFERIEGDYFTILGLPLLPLLAFLRDAGAVDG